MERLRKIIFAGIIIFLPSQLGLHFWPNWAFINGVRIDYFSPTIYFTDVLVGLLFVLSLRGKSVAIDAAIFFRRRKIASSFWLLAMTLFIFINIYFSYSPFATIYKWLKVAEMGFLIWFVAKNSHHSIKLQHITVMLLIPIIYSCVLAVWQYLNHGSIGGLWYFLGERTFTFDTLGIAAGRPYATFSHPNVLMGFLFVSCSLVIKYVPHISRKITALILILVALVVFLTLSKGNLQNGWNLRMQLNNLAIEQFNNSPIFGTGLGTSPLYPRNITNFAMLHQPIHNIYLLILSETGIIGLFLFGFLIIKTFKHLLPIAYCPLLIILLLGFFDHYWLTQQQTLLLFAMILGIIKK